MHHTMHILDAPAAQDLCYYIIEALGFAGGCYRRSPVSKFIPFWNKFTNYGMITVRQMFYLRCLNE